MLNTTSPQTKTSTCFHSEYPLKQITPVLLILYNFISVAGTVLAASSSTQYLIIRPDTWYQYSPSSSFKTRTTWKSTRNRLCSTLDGHTNFFIFFLCFASFKVYGVAGNLEGPFIFSPRHFFYTNATTRGKT